MATFSAALIAGGQSSRMGRDKALLPAAESGQLLWEWQWRKLEQLQPQEIFWSGPPRPGLPANVKIIRDEVDHAGPLAGISACLDALKSDLLVVLAIDLPRMNPEFLQGLIKQSSATCGAVGRRGDFFEPLAAVYPKALHELAKEHLKLQRYALRDLVGEAVKRGLIQAVEIGDVDIGLFRNVNSPADL